MRRSICAFIIILSTFTLLQISQTHVSAQPNFSQFNVSDVFNIVDDIIPGITDVIDNGNLPTNPLNPTNIIDQLFNGQLSSIVLTGPTLSAYVSQFGQNLSPDAVIPELLKNFNSQLPANALATITTFNPQTGLFDILGALTGKTTMAGDLMKFTPNISYLLRNAKIVPNYSGKGCPRGNNLTNAPEGTIGPLTFNDPKKYICQNGKWNLYVFPTLSPSPILSPGVTPGVIISRQPQIPTPSTIITTPRTTQGGTCTCTCTGSFKGCGPGPHNNGSFLNHLSCEEGTDSASGSESVTSSSECTINTCIVRAPAYAQKIGQEIAAKKGAHLEYINITGCSSAIFTPNP